MKFNFHAIQGEWFQFVDSHIDLNTGEIIYGEPIHNAKIQIRNISPFIEERLSKRKRLIEHVYNPKTRAMERLSYYEELTFAEAKAERQDTYDYAITNWENMEDDETGELVPCTRENKLKAMENPIFDRFIARCLQMIASSGAKAKEESEKNS